MAEVTTESEIRRLREQLLAFVVAEASASLSEKADMPLPAALAAAIDKKVNEAVTRSVGENAPSAEALSAKILEAVRARLPELAEGDVPPPKRGGKKGSGAVFGPADDLEKSAPHRGGNGETDQGGALGIELTGRSLAGLIVIFILGLMIGWVVHGMTASRDSEIQGLDINATSNVVSNAVDNGVVDANATKAAENQTESKADETRANATLVNTTAAAPSRDRNTRDNNRPAANAATATDRARRDQSSGDSAAAPAGAVNLQHPQS